MNDKITELKIKRFQYLHRLYAITGGDKLAFVGIGEIGKELGITHEESDRIEEYLHDEGLLDFPAFGNVSITHRGVLEVEEALSRPEKPTQHFPPMNFIHIEHMENSQVQQGTYQSTQMAAFTPENLKTLNELVQKLKQELPQVALDSVKEKEAQAEIATIEAQLSSSKPKRIIIEESLKTLRAILEGAAGSAIAAGLMQVISSILR